VSLHNDTAVKESLKTTEVSPKSMRPSEAVTAVWPIDK